MSSIYDDGPAETNRTRASWAVIALDAFGVATGQRYTDGTLNVDEEELNEIASDLLANLFHLARINLVDPDEIVGRAYLHFNEEVAEEEGADGPPESDTKALDDLLSILGPLDLRGALRSAVELYGEYGDRNDVLSSAQVENLGVLAEHFLNNL
ncbi:hypothetical protein ACFRKD_32140 [Streptomyces niveus]|uniref:hypothetical protein n=1 Tax=Streptomyces niveus TaxID=193462 RepID=UPI0036830247